MDLPDTNSLAGIAALVNSLLMAPSVVALRKIVKRHEAQLEEHDGRINEIAAVKSKSRRRPRRK